MEKPLERGSFVQDTRHPEYGVGRVLNAGAFATRVLFTRGGLRVFRVDEAGKLRPSAPPTPEDMAVLAAKEALAAQGIMAQPEGAKKKPASASASANAKPAKAKKAKAKATGGAV